MPKTLAEYRSSLNSARNRIQKTKAETEAATRRVVNGTMVVAGGGLVGIIRGMSDGPGYIPGTEVAYETAVAAGLAVLGVFDAAGDYSDELGSLGAGMGAAIAAPLVERSVEAMKAK